MKKTSKAFYIMAAIFLAVAVPTWYTQYLSEAVQFDAGRDFASVWSAAGTISLFIAIAIRALVWPAAAFVGAGLARKFAGMKERQIKTESVAVIFAVYTAIFSMLASVSTITTSGLFDYIGFMLVAVLCDTLVISLCETGLFFGMWAFLRYDEGSEEIRRTSKAMLIGAAVLSAAGILAGAGLTADIISKGMLGPTAIAGTFSEIASILAMLGMLFIMGIFMRGKPSEKALGRIKAASVVGVILCAATECINIINIIDQLRMASGGRDALVTVTAGAGSVMCGIFYIAAYIVVFMICRNAGNSRTRCVNV